MSIGIDFTVEDIVQKVLGSKLKVIAKDKELLQKQRKKINNSIYLKSQKTLTQKEFIQNYELQECNSKLQERLKILQKKYQKQFNKYKQSQNAKEEIQKIKQKLVDITNENLKLQKKLDKVRITKLKLDSRQNTLNLCNASSQRSNNINYSKSKSPMKYHHQHNKSLQNQHTNKCNVNTNFIHPFQINSQKQQKINQEILQYQNKAIQTDYNNKALNKQQEQVKILKIQLNQKKAYIQQLRKIAQSQQSILEDYYEVNQVKQENRNNQNKKIKQMQMKTGLKVMNNNKNIEQTQGKIVNLTKKINRGQSHRDNQRNQYRKTRRQQVSQFLCSEKKHQQEHLSSPIAGTIIKVKAKKETF